MGRLNNGTHNLEGMLVGRSLEEIESFTDKIDNDNDKDKNRKHIKKTKKRQKGGVLSDKNYEVDSGPIPENPSEASQKDIEAIKEYYRHRPNQFPSGKYLDVREWENWRDISIKYNEDNSKWTVSYRGFFKDEEVIQEFNKEKKAQFELCNLKNYNKQIALELIREARKFAIRINLYAPWTDTVDVSSGTVMESESETTPASEGLAEGEVNEAKKLTKEYFGPMPEDPYSITWTDTVDVSGETVMGSESAVTPLLNDETTSGVGTPNSEVAEVQATDTGPEGEGEALPGLDELGAALDSLDSSLVEEIATQESEKTENGRALARVEQGGYTREPDIESGLNSLELDGLKERAQEAINKYQQFNNNNPKESRTPAIQEQYRNLEKEAWDRVRELAHKLGGDISQELPQLRNILESYRDLNNTTDAKQYFLEQGNIIVNEEGNITHIVDDQNNLVELNRPRTFEEIFDKSRPVHILYRTDEEGKKIGYVVDGLNENTLTWIETTLSGNTIPRAEIIDGTGHKDPESGASPATNPEVSAYSLDILDLYIKKGFSDEQLRFIQEGINSGDTKEQIALYAKPKYGVANMMVIRETTLDPNLDISQYEGLPYWQQTWIINGIRAGHTKEQIALYAKLGISSEYIKEIQSYIQNGLTIEQINEKQIKKIAEERYLNSELGISRDMLIRQLESEGFTNEQATQAIYNMDIDWSQQAIKKAKSYLESRSRSETEENWSKNELIRQLMSDLEQFTDAQARLAVDNISDYNWKEEEESNPETIEQAEEGDPTRESSLDDLRFVYARAEEAWNRKRGDLELENVFESAREAYNTELERVLKLQVAEGQAVNISQMFKDEVMSLRDIRIEQSQELQGVWEKRFNVGKEKFLGWATKNKRNWMITNAILFAGATGLSLLGAGVPVAGSIHLLRRSLGSVMSGVGARNTLVGLMEDRDIRINKFGLNINFQAEVPKIVKESISESEDQIKQVSDEVLKDRLGTLDAYYRLNGGKFNDNQQQAYEKVLTELGNRVRIKALENYYNDQKNTTNRDNDEEAIESNPDHLTEADNQAEQDSQSSEIVDFASLNFAESGQSSRYTSELLNTISDTRIAELDKFRRKRKIATVVGFATTGVLGGLLLNDMVKPGSMFRPDIEGSGKPPTASDPTLEVKGPGDGSSGPGGAGGYPSAPDLPSPEEALRIRQAAAAANEAREVLAQDASNLTSKETLLGEIREWLGPNASEAQIQQAVEKYLGSIKGQDTIFKLAQQTEDGRALLSQWDIDNAGEMSGLSKERLYEVSKYLGEGKLDGLTELSLDNLDALEQAVAPEVTGAPTIEPGSTEAPAPQVSEFALEPSEITQNLSEILGKQNLTDIQAKEIVQSYFADDYGREAIYNSIINTGEGVTVLSNGFGVNTLADFANITPDQMYEITNSLDADILRKIINETILSKFETDDIVEITKVDSPLGAINRYIASEVGNLPYDSNLGKQVLDTYIQTDTGKLWLYDAIVSNPNPNNQNVQLFREYLRFKDIKSPEEFVSKFNWAEFSNNKNIPTSGFWNQIRLPNGEARLQPLSTFLQPSKMTGIPEAIRQVLIK